MNEREQAMWTEYERELSTERKDYKDYREKVAHDTRRVRGWFVAILVGVVGWAVILIGAVNLVAVLTR